MKQKFVFLIVFLISLQLCCAVYADEPNMDSTAPETADITAVAPEESPAVTAVPDAAAAAPAPSYTPVPTASALPSEEPDTDEVLSDAAYMEALTIAFLDGIETITPEQPQVRFEIAVVRVPETRVGSAQWFLNGQPVDEFYSPAFTISNGKVTGMNFTVPFDVDYKETSATVALEIHLNGNVRRIEKTVALQNDPPEVYAQRNIDRVMNAVKPVEIEAVLRRDTTGYETKYMGGKTVSLSAGENVVYADHYSDYTAYIWLPKQEMFCWVPYYDVDISEKDYTVYEDFSDEDKEIFVNEKGYESSTDYLVWINLERQKVNVFTRQEDGSWKLEKTMPCATGANTTPTPTKQYIYSARSAGWFNPTYYVKPVLYMDTVRAIAMHSILFQPDGSISDGTMGTPVSHGCVRMQPADIQWLDQYLTLGSTIVVF